LLAICTVAVHFERMALTARHRLFVREYLKDKNGGRAYRAVYGRVKGSDQSAAKLLRTAKIAEAVGKALARIEAKLEISAERNLKRIAEIAYEKPRAKHTDVLKACELIGKHFKQFTEIHEHTGKDGGPQVILVMPANGSEAVSEPAKKSAKTSEQKK
jgi:phage terminase small subunit